MDEVRFRFPKQASISYVDSFLKTVREIREVENKKIIFDLSKTTEISSFCICFLCGLLDLIIEKNNSVKVVLPANRKASEVIKDVQLLSTMHDKSEMKISERMCQLRRITSNDYSCIDEILDIISHEMKIEANTRGSLKVILNELLTNVIDHSGEKTCYVCAGAWGRSRNLHVTFLDFGVGIPSKLRTRYPQYNKDEIAMKELLDKGLTTRTDRQGGLGYKHIQDILKRNKGRLHIFSNLAKIVLKYDKGEYNFKKAQKVFNGTCIDIQFNMDGENLYSIVKEMNIEECF